MDPPVVQFTDKPALRRHLRALRRELAAGRPDAADQAAAHLPVDRLPPFASVAAYNPAGAEMDPLPACGRLTAMGALLALPVAETLDGALSFQAWTPGDPLVKDASGVLAPGPSAPSLRPDVVIAPLLAFDRRGGRLGQGGGHYDRTIANLRAAGPVFVLGLAYAGQELPEIPMEPHDQRLDAILTETGYIEVS